MKVEMMTAIGAILVSLVGSVVSYYKLKDGQRSWEHGQKISIEKELLFEKLKKRYIHYHRIFKLLGNVRDIEYPKEHYIELENNKQQLITTADLILNELYGESGLFMEYETRSLILKTYQASYKYANNKISLNDLIDSYYLARRSLRKDLEFDDYSASKSAKDILKSSKTELKELNEMKEKSFWAKKDLLAQSSRPGYPNKIVSQQVVQSFVTKWKKAGIKSIICLLSNEELIQYYKNINSGLLNYYKKNGFDVVHLPIEDFQFPPISKDNLNIIIEEYKKLSKPVLVHCGAGLDRTGIVIDSILELS